MKCSQQLLSTHNACVLCSLSHYHTATAAATLSRGDGPLFFLCTLSLCMVYNAIKHVCVCACGMHVHVRVALFSFWSSCARCCSLREKYRFSCVYQRERLIGSSINRDDKCFTGSLVHTPAIALSSLLLYRIPAACVVDSLLQELIH